MVEHWHELGEVDNDCTLHNFILFAILVPKKLYWNTTYTVKQ